MASVSFVLKDDKSPTSILMLFRYDNKRVKIYTKQSIEPVFGDKSKKKVRNSIKINSQDINSKLNEMENAILELYDKILSEYGRRPEPF